MKPKVKEIIFGAFAVILIPVGFSIHSWFSLCFLLAGSICVAFALYFTLLNHRVHGVDGTEARNWSWLLFVVFCLGAFFYWREYKQPPNPPEPKRHLALYAHTTDAPDINLDFTNKFLFAKMGKNQSFEFPTNLPFLVVEVAKNDPQFTLHFGIFNDSAPRFSPPEYDIQKPELNVWITDPDPSETIKWQADVKWKRASMVDGKSANQMLVYDFPDSLSAGTGGSTPGITFNMQERASGVPVAVLVAGKGVIPTTYGFKLLAIPSNETTSKMHFDTNSVISWNWKYRPVAYRPLDSPIEVSPSRVRLSDGTNLFGTKVSISNPTLSNLYAITFSVEIENGAVPISSSIIDLSQPQMIKTGEHGELSLGFEASMDSIGNDWQSRLFVIPVLQANESRLLWIRGTIATNSFAEISIWQVTNAFPSVQYLTNGTWLWPVLTFDSPFWMHAGLQPMNFDFGILAWRGDAAKGFTNASQIIPSHP